MTEIGNGQECVNSYENVFQACGTLVMSTAKTRLIQALIQVEIPIHWNRENLLHIIKNVKRYNAFESKTIHKFKL
jgi:hypothetical protein